MDFSRPKRMIRPRAAARRMAQVSVDRLKVEWVLGVDMWSLLKECAEHTKKRVAAAWKFLKKGYDAGETSYNNSVLA
jgi:hypothetical protein